MLKGLCDVLKPYNTIVNNLRNHAQGTYTIQRWCCVYSQVSEQSSLTNIINRQVTINSTSNVTAKFRITTQQCINASKRVRCDNGFIKKAAYTVAIIVIVHNNSWHAFMAIRNKTMFCGVITVLFQNCITILRNT